MKKYLLTIAIFLKFSVNAQSFTEILEFWDNGGKKKEVVKNLDLQLIRENEYDIFGYLISQKNYDPSTKKLNGEFFNEDFKGNYDQGKLNCSNCKLYLKSGSPEIVYSEMLLTVFLKVNLLLQRRKIYISREWTTEEENFIDYQVADAQAYLTFNPYYAYKSDLIQ